MLSNYAPSSPSNVLWKKITMMIIVFLFAGIKDFRFYTANSISKNDPGDRVMEKRQPFRISHQKRQITSLSTRRIAIRECSKVVLTTCWKTATLFEVRVLDVDLTYKASKI